LQPGAPPRARAGALAGGGQQALVERQQRGVVAAGQHQVEPVIGRQPGVRGSGERFAVEFPSADEFVHERQRGVDVPFRIESLVNDEKAAQEFAEKARGSLQR
jgi:hypothetical protein